jgi:hypothetical protein
MREKARVFFEEAKFLCAAGKYNGGASRLYYALYHIITSIFEEMGVKQSDLTNRPDPGYWRHDVVVYNSTIAGVNRMERLTVETALDLRIVSDYKNFDVQAADLQKLLPRVEKILRSLGVKV